MTGLFLISGLVLLGLISGAIVLVARQRSAAAAAAAAAPAGATPAGAPTPTLWNRVKAWYAEEWIKASVGGVILIILLILLNHNLAWWLSGHHPRLFISLVLFIVLGVFVLKKDYDKTKKWIWRVGLIIVLVFGIGGAILEDWHKGEPNIDKAIVGGEQREALKEVAQEVTAAMPKISLPTLPSLSPAAYTTPVPVLDPVDQAKLRPGALVYYVGSQGAWIPAPRGVNVEWRGRANVCPDLPGPNGPRWSYDVTSSEANGQTKNYLWVQPLNGPTEVVVVHKIG